MGEKWNLPYMVAIWKKKVLKGVNKSNSESKNISDSRRNLRGD